MDVIDALNALEEAYNKGWNEAAKWAGRRDLISDLGSPAYRDKMEENLMILKDYIRRNTQ